MHKPIPHRLLFGCDGGHREGPEGTNRRASSEATAEGGGEVGTEEDAKANKKKDDAQSVKIEEVEGGDSSDGLEHEDKAPSKVGSKAGTAPLSLVSGLTFP